MKKIALITLAFLTMSASANEKGIRVECQAGNLSLFNKTVDSVEYIPNGIIAIKHRTRTTIINTPCKITEELM